jgi:Ca-activated chloride channel family protein
MNARDWTILESALLIAGGIAMLAILAWLLSRLEKRRGVRLADFADHPLLDHLVAGHAPWLRKPLNLYIISGAACLMVALIGPRWGESEPDTRRGSREILVLLDTSESMNAVNPAPSRLARAQSKIGALLEACPGDRFGLIAFSGAAVLQCPFTRDHAYFKTILQSVTTDTLTEEGTNIESALVEAERLFEGGRGVNGASAGDRLILLVSDGESPEAGAAAAARRLSSSGRIAVMGIGDADGAVVSLPQWMERSRLAPTGGHTHLSRLDEEALADIALAGGGVYVRSTLGGEDLAVIQREMAYLDGMVGSDDARSTHVNRYRWPLAAAIIFFVAEGLWLVGMPHMVRRVALRQSTREATDAVP